MHKIKKETIHLIIKNTLLFIMTLTFIFAFQTLFGTSNILLAVSLSVGLVSFPVIDYNIKPMTMTFIIIFLYTLTSIIPQFSLYSPWLSLPINFLLVVIVIALSHEPELLKPSISFLINFIFLQSMPVSLQEFPTRLIGAILGSIFVACITLVFWKKRGYGTSEHSRNLKQQMQLCIINRSYIFRMSLGVSLAMLIGALLHLKKPLWLSIVVMSLTQLEFSETLERIKHRFLGTLVGVVLFFIFFQIIIPKQYAMIVILAIGYFSYFVPEYKYKQVVNAISALNASLVLLDTPMAITNRILCLIGGILIVLVIYMFAYLYKIVKRRYRHKKYLQV